MTEAEIARALNTMVLAGEDAQRSLETLLGYDEVYRLIEAGEFDAADKAITAAELLALNYGLGRQPFSVRASMEIRSSRARAARRKANG